MKHFYKESIAFSQIAHNCSLEHKKEKSRGKPIKNCGLLATNCGRLDGILYCILIKDAEP